MSEELESMQALAKEQLAPLTRVRALERGLAALQGSRADLSGQIAQAQEDRAQAMRRRGHDHLVQKVRMRKI